MAVTKEFILEEFSTLVERIIIEEARKLSSVYAGDTLRSLADKYATKARKTKDKTLKKVYDDVAVYLRQTSWGIG